MAVPRLSQGAESARIAAAQAEFNEKKWVWVPDDKEGYLAGWVIREEDDSGEVVMAAGGEMRRLPLYALSKMNPPKFDRVDDIADLTFLNEASVVHNLRLRYGSGAIYTYSSLFLVAINPYQNLPLYSDAIVQQYRGKRRDENPPHIFAVAERAWVSMGEERENQSILITGESGAGKTENTKKVIQYLAAIASDVHSSHTRSPSLASASSSFNSGLPRSQSMNRKSISSASQLSLTTKGRLGLLERQILQANPILEAFGNAQTQRNNNSSRFGKFIRISFAPDGSIAGANVDWYLLEKSRVVVRSEAERSFHVFYQLMEADLQLKEQLLLDGGVEDYEFLNKSRREVDGVDDREEWKQLKNALEVVGFSAAEQFNLFRIVAAILHIGNITITSTRADDALMPDSAQAERVCHLLGIPVGEFTKAVLRPRVLAGREWVTQARTRQHALDELSALCKTLYEKSFGALVDRINRALDRPSSKSTFIGVLDIAGFEIFDVNAYEQLLINYTNEKLQQFFNHHMFELEQEEYARESIEWEYHDFGLDSQPTIELIEASGNTIGILSCLDEECIMPKATDATFTHKLHQLWTGEVQDGEKSHPGRDKYTPARFEQGFIVKHYAGNVEYRTEGWLEKNKDPLNDNLSRLLAVSDEPYVAGLFSDYADGLPANGSVVSGLVGTVGKKRTVRKGAFRTVGQRHKEQLASLMNQLKGTQPHFVRCIVPNGMKKAGRMDVPLVLDQLRCNGVLEGIRIARLGYPNRLPFVEFRQRYEVLTPGIIPRGYMDGRKACLRMVDALELDKSTYRIGTSKLFFKAGILADLEERRDALLFDIFSRLQGAARMWTARRQMKKILNRAIAVRTIQRNARIYGELREWPWWQLYTKVRPLLAATRNDEELRRKEAELALFKERAERDLREKEALEGLKMRLEADKRKVEDDLEAERSVGLEKDVQLKRSADRISELEEDVSALQTDLDTLDSQLDRVMANHKATEEKYEALREAFDEAANHLVRFEQDQKEWKIREEELSQSLAIAEEKLEVLQAERDELRRASDDAKRQLTEREEDILRAKERLEATVTELEAKLASEIRARELAKARSDTLEHEVRQAQEQLAEMARTANQYDTLITKKEAEIARLTADLEHLSDEKDEALKKITQLQGQAETAKSQLDAQKGENVRSTEMRARLQKELDELRALMQAKSSEETRRKEVEKSKEKELLDLRTQQSRLQQELSESKKIYIEDQNRLKADLETALRENASLQQQYQQLVDSERAIQTRQKELDTALSDADRAKRTLESELQIAKTRQTDVEGQYADAIKAKEMLERQMASAQAKVEDYEEAVIQLEREKSNWVRQMDQTRQQLDDEKAKRQQLDKHASTQKAEILRLKDINIKLDRELNKTLDNLKAREWEVKQLESRQDKTIVEHVHVLEEAKRVTDRQLAEAQAELQKNVSYIRSLEKSKARLASEAEDLTRAAEQESRARAKDARTSEEKASRAAAEALDAKRAKEAAEIRARRSENELQTAKDQIAFLEQQLVTVQKSKSTLESELSTLADETTTPNSLAKVRREYESRISQLQNDLEQAEAAQSTANRIKDLVERHHAEIRKLILQGAPHDDGFRSRLLQELQQTEKGLSMEFSNRSLQFRDPGSSGVRSVTSTPTKSTNKPLNGIIRGMKEVPEAPRTPDHHQVDRLKQQVQVLELQMAASDRVRRHLEASLRDLTAELESLDGSKQSLQSYKARMAKENARLEELLNDEAQARRTSEASHLDGLQSMWDKFQSTISEERESYNRLEESRRALIVQQRNAQTELEAQRRQNQELTQMKMKLQSELTNLQDKVEREKLARSEESNTKRKLQGELQDAKVSSAAASMKHSELAEAVKAYRAKAESYLTRLEQNEIERAKAANGEAFARKALEDLEKAHAQALKERKAAEERASKAEQNLRDLSAELEHGDRQSSDLELGRQRLEEELQEERDRHAADLSERDFAMSQTQITYQTKLAELSDELQSQRESMSRLREENRKLRSDYDELQLQYDDEVYSGGAWKNEKERLETKITDLTNAYESSTAARTEQQSQIVALHSQVRELRGVLEDAEAERVMLQKARRALQAQLDGIKLDHIDPDKMSAESKLQDLQLKKQDLERALEEHQDRVMMAEERMKKAEVHAQDCQIELGEIRVENSELDRKNANLEKQVKELNVRIVDLETKAYASASRLKGEVLRQNRTGDRPVSRTGGTPAESDRMRSRLEEEVKSYEAKIAAMREDMAALSSKEGNLQIAKRKAEREASEYKQLVLSLEREVERLRSRLEWPSSALQSPAGSPRKYGS